MLLSRQSQQPMTVLPALLFIVWAASSIMDVRLAVIAARRPRGIGIKIARPDLVRIARQQRQVRDDARAVVHDGGTPELFTGIPIERLSSGRLRLHLDTASKRLFVSQALTVICSRSVKRHLGLPRDARCVMWVELARQRRQLLRALPHARTATNRALVRPAAVRKPGALFCFRRILRSLLQLFGCEL